MATQSKKHHYVPQSVLKRFSINGRGRQVFVFDKTSDQVRREGILHTGMENHFNTVVVEGVRENFEHEFNGVEGAMAGAHRRLLETRNASRISDADWHALTDGVAAQLFRTKLYRTTLRAMAEDLASALEKIGPVNPPIAPIEEQAARAIAREAIRERESARLSLTAKKLLLIEPEPGGEFWISDNPVVQHNSFPYGDLGLDARGIEVYYPIARDLVLGFFCPTTALHVSRARALGDRLEEPLRSQCAELDEAFVSGRPTQLNANGASQFLNELQTRAASRFVYSAQDDFSLARRVLELHPQLRSVRSTIKVGELGGGPPRRTGVPDGLRLVVFGREGNHVLPIDELDDEPMWGFDVLASEGRTVQAMIEDQPWERVVVFDSGRERRGMRLVKAEAIQEADRWRVKIRQDLAGLARR